MMFGPEIEVGSLYGWPYIVRALENDKIRQEVDRTIKFLIKGHHLW